MKITWSRYVISTVVRRPEKTIRYQSDTYQYDYQALPAEQRF